VILQSGWTKYAEDYEMIAERVMVVGAMVITLPPALLSSLSFLSSPTIGSSSKSPLSSIMEVLELLQLDSVLETQHSFVHSLAINISGVR
jgi:hypothetical protein